MTREMRVVALVVAIGGAGCGIGVKGPDEVALTSTDLIGTWSTPVSVPGEYAGCAFVVAFAADGTYGAGTVCSAETLPLPPEPPTFQLEVDWVRGAFTAAPDGRINFLASERPCANDLTNYHADYSGPASRPTVTIPWPTGDLVLSPSSGPSFDDAIFGCFDSGGAFTPSPAP